MGVEPTQECVPVPGCLDFAVENDDVDAGNIRPKDEGGVVLSFRWDIPDDLGLGAGTGGRGSLGVSGEYTNTIEARTMMYRAAINFFMIGKPIASTEC